MKTVEEIKERLNLFELAAKATVSDETLSRLHASIGIMQWILEIEVKV